MNSALPEPLPASLEVWLLTFVRLLAIFAGSGLLWSWSARGWFAWRGSLGLAAVLAWPVSLARPAGPVPGLLAAVPAEMLLGLMLGWGAGLVPAGCIWAASLVQKAAGLPEGGGDGWSETGDPGDGDVFPRLAEWLTIVVILQGGLHRQALAALFACFERLPVGTVLGPGTGWETWPAVGTSLFELTVRLALPTAMVGGLVQAALALAARSSPVFRAWGGGVVLLTFLVPAVWGLTFRSTAVLLEHAVERFCELLRGFPAGL